MKEIDKILILIAIFVILFVGALFSFSYIYQKDLREICEDIDLKYSGQAECYKIEDGRTIIYEINRVGSRVYVNDRVGSGVYVNKFPRGSIR